MFDNFMLIVAGDNCAIGERERGNGRLRRGKIHSFGIGHSSVRSVVEVAPTEDEDGKLWKQFELGNDIIPAINVNMTYEKTKLMVPQTGVDCFSDIQAARKLSVETLLVLVEEKVRGGRE